MGFANDAAGNREVTQCAQYRGVVALVDYALKDRGLSAAWPEDLVDRIGSDAPQPAAWDALRHRESLTVLKELAKAGAYPLLLNVTALAYILYPEPALRHHSDTDMPIREIVRDSLSQVSVRRGYVHSKGIAGELVRSQSTFSRFGR